jgi:hypothetical protein
MQEPVIRFPVACPTCRTEVLAALPWADVADALLQNTPVGLYAICHDIFWTASPTEIEQLREYMGAVWVAEHKA